MPTAWRAALGGALLLLSACAEPPPEEPSLALSPVGYGDLAGWRDDDHAAALTALARSCARFAALPDDRAVGPDGLAGTVADWRELCAAAAGAHTKVIASASSPVRFMRFLPSGPFRCGVEHPRERKVSRTELHGDATSVPAFHRDHRRAGEAPLSQVAEGAGCLVEGIAVNFRPDWNFRRQGEELLAIAACDVRN